MSEAEVSLRLAFWLADQGFATERINVAIDGAQVRTGDTIHFDLAGFLSESGWKKARSSDGWRGSYTVGTYVWSCKYTRTQAKEMWLPDSRPERH